MWSFIAYTAAPQLKRIVAGFPPRRPGFAPGSRKLWSSSLCSFLQPPVTSFLFGPNNLLSALFSNTLSLCSSLNVRDQVSRPYRTTWKILWPGYTAVNPRRKDASRDYRCESLTVCTGAQVYLLHIRTIIMAIQIVPMKMETRYSYYELSLQFH
jgi:hypothetical protein